MVRKLCESAIVGSNYKWRMMSINAFSVKAQSVLCNYLFMIIIA